MDPNDPYSLERFVYVLGTVAMTGLIVFLLMMNTYYPKKIRSLKIKILKQEKQDQEKVNHKTECEKHKTECEKHKTKCEKHKTK
ncbi:hypothetical protein [Methanolapillus ohkumae]|uniref:hypothetical protein n=1 Tax=Methanolapillus ohkumae TaxID=3028298 RepID=UPI0030B8C274